MPVHFEGLCRKPPKGGDIIPVLMNVCCFSFTSGVFMLHTVVFQHLMEMICCNFIFFNMLYEFTVS